MQEIKSLKDKKFKIFNDHPFGVVSKNGAALIKHGEGSITMMGNASITIQDGDQSFTIIPDDIEMKN